MSTQSPSPVHSTTTPLIGIEAQEGVMRATATLAYRDHTPRQWHLRLDVPPTPADAVVQLAALVARVLDGSGIAADERPCARIGLACWDPIASDEGRVRASRFGAAWSGYPLASELARVSGLPVAVDYAPRAAALTESVAGAGQSYASILHVLQGRSVWGTMAAQGQVLHGASDRAGDLAHVRVSVVRTRCTCGELGHLQPIASARAIVGNLIGKAAASEQTMRAIHALTGHRAEAITATQVAMLAESGDAVAGAVVREAVEALAEVLSSTVLLLDPAGIVLAGPLAQCTSAFVQPLAAQVSALLAPVRAAPPLIPAALGTGAVLAGACLLAEHVRN